jgi:hypothetical protein
MSREQQAASDRARRDFHRSAAVHQRSDIFVNVLHDTHKYVSTLNFRPARRSAFFRTKRADVTPATPDDSGAHLADTDTTVGDSQKSADPIFPVR